MVQSWWSDYAVARSLQAKFSDRDISISVGWQYGQLNGVLIMFNKVKNIGDINPLFQFLGKHGYLHEGKPEITYCLKRISWKMGNIIFSAFFDDSNAECKFVKVGTKTEDEYKFVCPDYAP